jgi:hypothetical protein
MPLAPKKAKAPKAERSELSEDLISSTMDGTSQYVRALLIGMSKSGKTLFGATAPKPLIIDCGKTLATLSARKLKIPVISIVPESDELKVTVPPASTFARAWRITRSCDGPDGAVSPFDAPS